MYSGYLPFLDIPRWNSMYTWTPDQLLVLTAGVARNMTSLAIPFSAVSDWPHSGQGGSCQVFSHTWLLQGARAREKILGVPCTRSSRCVNFCIRVCAWWEREKLLCEPVVSLSVGESLSCCVNTVVFCAESMLSSYLRCVVSILSSYLLCRSHVVFISVCVDP